MRKFFPVFLFLFGLFALDGISAAYYETVQLNRSSFTLTNETTTRISSFTLKGGLLVGVIIDSPSVNGTLTLADAYVSTSVAGITYSTLSILSLSGGGNSFAGQPVYIPFNILLSSGIAYTTSNNVGGITIIYKSFNPIH